MSVDDAPQRFEAKYQRRSKDECWHWTGSRNKKGYGNFASGRTNGRRGGSILVLAHRWAYEYYEATPVPDGMKVLHGCGNHDCVNPSHLYLAENSWDLPNDGGRRKPLHGEANGSAKLTEADVSELRIRVLSGASSSTEEAKRLGLSHNYVREVVSGKTWGHVAMPSVKLDSSWVTVAQAAEQLGITVSGVLRRASAGRLQRVKVRGRVYVRSPR